MVVNGIDPDRLTRTADEIARQTGATMIPVAADVTTPDGRAALMAAMPDPDILVTNAAGPPPGDFRQIDNAALHLGVEMNMATPIALVQAVIDGMIERGWGRIVNITSASVMTSIVGLDLSSGARAGLTAFLGGVARQVAPHGVTINHLLPGMFDTDRQTSLNRTTAEKQGITFDRAVANRVAGIPVGRLADPSEFGAACAFLCSDKAGFITGQSLLMDGGAFASNF